MDPTISPGLRKELFEFIDESDRLAKRHTDTQVSDLRERISGLTRNEELKKNHEVLASAVQRLWKSLGEVERTWKRADDMPETSEWQNQNAEIRSILNKTFGEQPVAQSDCRVSMAFLDKLRKFLATYKLDEATKREWSCKAADANEQVIRSFFQANEFAFKNTGHLLGALLRHAEGPSNPHLWSTLAQAGFKVNERGDNSRLPLESVLFEWMRVDGQFCDEKSYVNQLQHFFKMGGAINLNDVCPYISTLLRGRQMRVLEGSQEFPNPRAFFPSLVFQLIRECLYNGGIPSSADEKILLEDISKAYSHGWLQAPQLLRIRNEALKRIGTAAMNEQLSKVRGLQPATLLPLISTYAWGADTIASDPILRVQFYHLCLRVEGEYVISDMLAQNDWAQLRQAIYNGETPSTDDEKRLSEHSQGRELLAVRAQALTSFAAEIGQRLKEAGGITIEAFARSGAIARDCGLRFQFNWVCTCVADRRRRAAE